MVRHEGRAPRAEHLGDVEGEGEEGLAGQAPLQELLQPPRASLLDALLPRRGQLAAEALQLAQRDIDSSRPNDDNWGGPGQGGWGGGRRGGGGDVVGGILGGLVIGSILDGIFD